MVIYTMKCPECGNEMMFDTGAMVPNMTGYPEKMVIAADERHTCHTCRIVITRHMTRTFVHEKSEVVPPRWLANPPTDTPQPSEPSTAMIDVSTTGGTGDVIAHTEKKE